MQNEWEREFGWEKLIDSATGSIKKIITTIEVLNAAPRREIW